MYKHTFILYLIFATNLWCLSCCTNFWGHTVKRTLPFLLFVVPLFLCIPITHRLWPPSKIFLPVSVSVSVSCIGWREGDIFITVKLCLIALKESIEHSGSKSYGWETGNTFPQDTVSTLPVLSPASPPRKCTSDSCIFRIAWGCGFILHKCPHYSTHNQYSAHRFYKSVAPNISEE